MCFLLIRRSKAISIFLILAVALAVFFPATTRAATFSKYYIFLDKVEAASTTGGTVCVQPATSSSANHDLKISWPAGFTVSGTTSDWTASVSNLPKDVNGQTPVAWPGITGATVSVSSPAVTWAYASDQTLSNSNIYCFRFTNSSALTLPSATSGAVDKGTITTESSGPVTIDTGDFAMAIVSSTNDRISVSSTVTPTFNFALGSNSISLGNLPISGTPATGNTTMTISTNARNGWNAWIKSANGSLHSSTSGEDISSQGTYPATTNISGSEGYQLNAVATAGSPTIAPGYLDAATTTTGGKLDIFYENLATMTSPTSNAVVTLNLLGEASASRIAATDYNDTLTVVASGAF